LSTTFTVILEIILTNLSCSFEANTITNTHLNKRGWIIKKAVISLICFLLTLSFLSADNALPVSGLGGQSNGTNVLLYSTTVNMGTPYTPPSGWIQIPTVQKQFSHPRPYAIITQNGICVYKDPPTTSQSKQTSINIENFTMTIDGSSNKAIGTLTLWFMSDGKIPVKFETHVILTGSLEKGNLTLSQFPNFTTEPWELTFQLKPTQSPPPSL
jgi:hypothetical protein